MALLVMVFFTATYTQVEAQSCACKGAMQVSGATCGGGATITLMTSKTGGVILDLNAAIDSVTVNASLLIGKTIYAKVTAPGELNSCWTEIKVEDKLKPKWWSIIPDTCVVTCPSLGTYIPRAIDNCHAPRVYQVSEQIVVNNCQLPGIFAGPDTLKQIIRTYLAVDESGNISETPCTVVIYVTSINEFIWPKPIQIQCDDNYAKLTNGRPSPVAIGSAYGSGVPSLYPWLPTIKNGTYYIGRTPDGLRDTVSLSVKAGIKGSAQVCLTAPSDITLNFKAGSATLPTMNDSIFYTVNGVWVDGEKGGGMAPALPLAVPLKKGQILCIKLEVNSILGGILRFSLDTLMTGIPLTPDALNDCNLFVTYTDTEFPAVKCVKKIMRKWTIMEWSCNSKILEYNQLIEIIDSKGPVISNLKDDVATTNGHTCEGIYKLQKPTLVDNCSTNLTYDVTVYDGILGAGTPNAVGFYKGLKVTDSDKLAKLPIGCISIEYIAYDDCHNQSRDTIDIIVEDNTPPVAICKQNTTVGLTLDGKAWVNASSFDNGSYDECEIAKILVRRMNPEPCKPCPVPVLPGFTYVGEYINPGKTTPHHYYVSKHRANPKVAAKTAAAVGGYLVHISGSAENKWVYDKYKEWNLNEDYLIGLRDEKGKGVFTWVNGQPGSYRNWETGFPMDTIINILNPSNDLPFVRTLVSNGKWVNFLNQLCDSREYLYVVEIEDPCGFSESVGFCCSDVSNSPQVVVFRAIDKSGNWNECMVNATVQDKLPPQITCPPHMTISCKDYFDVTNLTKSFGWPTALDNCENVRITTDSVVDLTSCRIGRITRNFTATDPGGRSVTCQQIIMVVGGSNFAPTSFPRDTIIEACDDPEDNRFNPDNLGKPNVGNDNTCSLAASRYDDEIFTFNNSTGDACFKILRTWTIIDWCKFAPNTYVDTKGSPETTDDEVKTYPAFNYDGTDIIATNDDSGKPKYDDRRNRINTWRHTQIIKVVDKVAPVISCPLAKTVCTYDIACGSGYIELTASATDACTQTLRWSYKIDINNDGSFESSLSKSGLGNVINATGTYAVGTHKIAYTFEDRCGNLSTCHQLFTIKNCKAPTPYCLNGLATSLMPIDTNNNGIPDIGMVEIWATDFNNGSAHPCPNYTVAFSFSPITMAADSTPVLVKNRVYTCDSLLGRKDVRVYVAAVDPRGKVVLDDRNAVVQDYCSTFITIQDNFRVCGAGAGGRFAVSGSVMTETEIPVKDVSVSLEGGEKTMMTNSTGMFNFSDILGGGQYMIKPFKNDDSNNGISTLDLVMIQRHILDIEKITSPYKLIAADVNKDQKLTAADLTELRKLVLGTISIFSNNNSWRFIDKMYKFADNGSAHAEMFTEGYGLNNISSNMQVNFVSIKVGDINGNVKANATDANTESRSSNRFELTTQNQSFVAGQTVEIPFAVTNASEAAGFQFTVGFDTEILSLESVNGDITGMTDNNFGFTALGKGMLTVSYSKEKAMELAGGDRIITLTFKAKSNGTISEVVNINSDITKAEAYTSGLDVMDINLNVANRVAETAILHQNTPNPFRANTTIGFELPEAMQATLTIYDVTGKKLRAYSQEFNKGYNSLEINKNELGSAGVMYYTLEAAEFKATKKMVVIE